MIYIRRDRHSNTYTSRIIRGVICVILVTFMLPSDAWSSSLLPDSIAAVLPQAEPAVPVDDPDILLTNDSISATPIAAADSIPLEAVNAVDSIASAKPSFSDEWLEVKRSFNPDPTRAVWLSALFPGLGQFYNRRYWKLPIVIGGYMGLAYATSWNNSMLNDYTKAYQDIMDNDPTTKSYMNFFASTINEQDLDQTWLQNILKSRKNYFRRNRDLCIICMVALYLVAMVDAYVDASLSHFDISPDLSLQWAPAIMQDTRGARPSIGLNWALTF